MIIYNFLTIHVHETFNHLWIYTLQEIGEEFVEFLEKELNVSDSETETYNYDAGPQSRDTSGSPGTEKTEAGKESSIEDDIDEIEATLARLKKELGL